MQSNITLTSHDDLAVITMGNEARANSIDLEFCDAMLRALSEIEAQDKHRAVVLRATGRIFSSGGNLVQILGGLHRSDSFLETLISALNSVILALRRLPVPVIASVQGAAAAERVNEFATPGCLHSVIKRQVLCGLGIPSFWVG